MPEAHGNGSACHGITENGNNWERLYSAATSVPGRHQSLTSSPPDSIYQPSFNLMVGLPGPKWILREPERSFPPRRGPKACLSGHD